VRLSSGRRTQGVHLLTKRSLCFGWRHFVDCPNVDLATRTPMGGPSPYLSMATYIVDMSIQSPDVLPRRLHEERSPISCNAPGEARSAITTVELDVRLTAATCNDKVYAIPSICRPCCRSRRSSDTRVGCRAPKRFSARERDIRRLINPTLVCSNFALDEARDNWELSHNYSRVMNRALDDTRTSTLRMLYISV
jgi:hypothetical protein